MSYLIPAFLCSVVVNISQVGYISAEYLQYAPPVRTQWLVWIIGFLTVLLCLFKDKLTGQRDGSFVSNADK